MLGLDDYGSDVDSDTESPSTSTSASSKPTAPTKTTFALPPPKSSTSFSLPPPSNSTTTTTTTKPKKPKKIAINLPSLPPPEGDDNEGDDERPPAKKPRITPSTGAGSSSLLGMLPAPKQPVPVKAKKKEERVLGGGGGPGLVFHASRSTAQWDEGVDGDVSPGRGVSLAEKTAAATDSSSGPSTSFLPPSLKKGRPNVSLDEAGASRAAPAPSASKSSAPVVDFFSLSSASSSTTPTPSASIPPTSSTPTVAPTSSAPDIPTFRPPSPTLDDPYPGYYLLPSGAYAPYDPAYYASYARKWQADYDKHIRDLEKSQNAPETEGAQDVDMAAEMEKARREIKEREERKALTMGKAGKNENGEPEMPRMNIKGAKLGATARSRHQLTTLLTEAYLNREALEEKIAQGRRNRKEAGNKYGF